MSLRSAFSGLVGRFHSDIHTLTHKRDDRRIRLGDRLVALDRIAGTTFLGCVMVLALSLLSQTVGPLTVPGAIADSEDGTTAAAPKPDLNASDARVATAPLTSTDARRLQAKLKGLGFDPGPIDGMAGRRTLDALNRYRETRQLSRASHIDHASVADLLD